MDDDGLPPPRPDAPQVQPAGLPPDPSSLGLEPPIAARRRHWPVVAGLAALVLVVALVGTSLVTSSGRTALAYSFSQGQAAHYRMSMKTDLVVSAAGQSAPVDTGIEADVTWTVTSTDADGTAMVKQSWSNVSITANGQSLGSTELPTSTFRLTSDGRIVSSSGTTLISDGTFGAGQISADRLTAVLPDGAVKPGDTWSKSTTQTVFGSTLTYATDGSYLRNEQIDGVDAAVVETKATIPLNMTVAIADIAQLLGIPADQVPARASLTYGGTSTSDTVTWIDAKAKPLIKTTVSDDVDMTVAANGVSTSAFPSSFAMKGTMSITLGAA